MDDFKPSAFTPFLRRFTDEKARDLNDTRELYARIRALHRGSPYATNEGELDLGGAVYGAIRDRLSEPLEPVFCRLIHDLLRSEKVIFEFPALDFDVTHLSLNELTDLRQYLRSKEYFHTHEARITTLLRDGLTAIVSALAGLLPESLGPSPFTVPLVYLLPDPKSFLDNLYGELWQQRYVDNGLFVEVSRRMYLNMCAESGIADPHDPKKPVKRPSQSDRQLHDLVGAYLKGTPFHDFFLAPVPLKFTHEERYSHMHILGGSGAGKTTLLQNLILHDLYADDPPSLVVIDSQGDLIRKLSHLALFDPDDGPLADRLVLISPKDTKHPPALNIFDVNRDRLGRYDEAMKEQVTAGVIQTFDYLFAGLLGADLTAKQGVFFRFVARLMLSLPETLGRSATILDMIALMDDPAPYQPAIASLPPIQKNFFERDFPSKTFAQTKEQIRYRLNAILENPTLARLFTAFHTKIDLFECLNSGGIVLVDTAKDFLKGSSSHFGRIFISLVLQAILERAVIPEHKRHPAFLIVDEAASYFDSNIDDLLTEARKYRLGCVFAHQFLDQATSSLRSSLAANTSIKFAGSVSTSDARAMASDLRTTPEFILSQPRLHFAAHIRHVTPNAVSIPVPIGLLEAEPQMKNDAYERFVAANRAKVSIPATIDEGLKLWTSPSASPSVQPAPPSSPAPRTDPTAPSDEW